MTVCHVHSSVTAVRELLEVHGFLVFSFLLLLVAGPLLRTAGRPGEYAQEGMCK